LETIIFRCKLLVPGRVTTTTTTTTTNAEYFQQFFVQQISPFLFVIFCTIFRENYWKIKPILTNRRHLRAFDPPLILGHGNSKLITSDGKEKNNTQIPCIDHRGSVASYQGIQTGEK